MPSSRFFGPTEPNAALADDWTDSLAQSSTAPGVAALRFDQVYRAYFDDVCRWVRALGGPEGEREDLVQDVFVIVHRRLVDFDGNNLAGWLYQITRHRVRDFRRRRWFRVLLRSERIDETVAARTPEGPEAILDGREKQRLLAHLLSSLSECERAAFVLFEIEGRSGEEIALLQGVPINTIWTRVRKARAKLSARAQRWRRRSRGLP